MGWSLRFRKEADRMSWKGRDKESVRGRKEAGFSPGPQQGKVKKKMVLMENNYKHGPVHVQSTICLIESIS